VYPDDRFTAAQIAQLVAEPRLSVEFLPDEAETAETAAADAAQGPLDASGLDSVIAADGAQKALADLKVEELRELAMYLEIVGYGGMKKADLVAAIKAVQVELPSAGEA
jgi:hypothetical protein